MNHQRLINKFTLQLSSSYFCIYAVQWCLNNQSHKKYCLLNGNMAGDHQQNHALYETNCRAAFKMSAEGSKVIDCSWTRVKRSSSGAALQGVVGTYQTVTTMSMPTRSNQFLLPQSWCHRGRWNVNEIPHATCCCIVFQYNASDPFYTKIATIRCVGDARFVTSLVHSRLDYCNSVFAGLPACDIRWLQSVLNSSLRLYWCLEIWSRDVFATWLPLAADCRTNRV